MGIGDAFLTTLAGAQMCALAVLVVRLNRSRKRRPAIEPRPEGLTDTTVSVIVPTLNEGSRLGPCLAGLKLQGPPVHEILVVDSHSSDHTAAIVRDATTTDPRVQLVPEPPRPDGWLGKVWALQHGLSVATGDWLLGIDADVRPRPGMVAAVVAAAREHGYDVVSFSPKFSNMTVPEQWLQPSMLVTLVYRAGAAGDLRPNANRVLANGQCFLVRRSLLLASGGYASARSSWSDDVTLARNLARAGARVGFLDGSSLYRVEAYDSVGAMWREWGRSFDLSDATTRAGQLRDVGFILLVQGIPLVVLLAFAASIVPASPWLAGLLIRVNVVLVAIRVLMLVAVRGSYERRSIGYWLSPLSDPIAIARLVLSSLGRPTSWRGRSYKLDRSTVD